jgi:hypothetical protein
MRQERRGRAAGFQLEQEADIRDGLATARKFSALDCFLHCPFFFCCSIVCRQNDVQPFPAANWGPRACRLDFAGEGAPAE